MTGLCCSSCDRTLPANARRCHPCDNTDLFGKRCTTEYRIADLFATLGRCQLWPSLGPFTECTISEILSRFQSAKSDHRHQCSAGYDCPLKRELETLSNIANYIVENMKWRLMEAEQGS